MKRIHIVGSGPRTGTTLITEMMISCFNIDLYTRHEDSIYAIPKRGAGICLTKRPQDILVIEPVLRILSDLYVIYMLRDPRDTIVSRHGKNPGKYWAGLKYWKTYSPVGERLKSHPRFITIKYEDLVSQPDKTQDYLISRMPFLSKHAAFSSYDKRSLPSKDSIDAMGGLRPVTSSSIGNWRRHLPRVAGQLQLHGSIADDLISYGYEQDDTWEKELIGIPPDLTAGYWPEYFSAYSLGYRRIKKYPFAVWVVLGHYRSTSFLLRPIQTLYKKTRAILRKLLRGVSSPPHSDIAKINFCLGGDIKTMKIFCIGFHKTATTSLAAALNILGYRVTGPNGVNDPCIASNVLSMADALVGKYDAFQDNPWPIIYKEMDAKYPTSKFILTVRDTESWINSTVRHFGCSETPMRKWIYGFGCPEGNEEIYIKRYNKHNKEVRDYFKNRPNDLLVIDLTKGDGWGKLCSFLGVAIPNIQFPHANKASERENS